MAPFQSFVFSFQWIKSKTPVNEFKRILRDNETHFAMEVMYKAMNNIKYVYELNFNFGGEFSEKKEKAGKWTLSVTSRKHYETSNQAVALDRQKNGGQ